MEREKHSKPELKLIVREVLDKDKPERVEELIQILRDRYSLSNNELIDVLAYLDGENILKRKKPESPLTAWDYIFSRETAWFWIILSLAVLATVILLLPTQWPPIIYLGYAFGIIFLAFLPGYALVRALFAEKLLGKSSLSQRTERIALSFAISLSIAPLVALVLNYSPWGITIVPILLSLLILTSIFACAALLRECMVKYGVKM